VLLAVIFTNLTQQQLLLLGGLLDQPRDLRLEAMEMCRLIQMVLLPEDLVEVAVLEKEHPLEMWQVQAVMELLRVAEEAVAAEEGLVHLVLEEMVAVVRFGYMKTLVDLLQTVVHSWHIIIQMVQEHCKVIP
jgi:hypothetical protein